MSGARFVRGARVNAAQDDLPAGGDEIQGGALYKNNSKRRSGDEDLHGRVVVGGREYRAKAWWAPARDGSRFLKLKLL
jgi:hypothetical protein